MSEGKVWIVEEGDYSDRHVVGVFTEETLAKACALGCDGDAEGWTLNPHAEQYRQGLFPWDVQMLVDGTAVYVDRTAPPPIDGQRLEYFGERPIRLQDGKVLVHVKDGRVYCDWATSGEKAMVLYTFVWARDMEHAIKIANERRAMHIANETWGAWGVLDKRANTRR